MDEIGVNGLVGWVAGNFETITNSASAETRVEAWAELGNMVSVYFYLNTTQYP